MKKFVNSQVVDTSYKISLRTLIMVGVIFNVLLSITATLLVGNTFGYKSAAMVITIGILVLFSIADSYILLGFLIKPLTAATKRLVLLAEGDLKSDTVAYSHLTETSVMVRAMNSVIEVNNQYINEISRVLGEIGNKNLTVEVQRDYMGDYAAIKSSLKNIIVFLNDTVQTIGLSADEVANSATMVSGGAVAISQGATEQASSVQELTASLDMIAEQTNLNAQNAQNANRLTVNAKANAEKGNVHMKEMLSAMEEINMSSASISKIIKVIDDIAFQTNILALNAAVEAARAGQHGKGFAVVAEEVRTLAGKSAGAASETTEMIESSIRKVEAGTKIANETASALNQIVDEVSKAAELVGSIAIASQEQKSSIEQINVGIQQVSKVVQTNAAASQESAAASEELSSQAEQMKETVSAFTLKRSPGSVPVISIVAAPALSSGASKRAAVNSGDFGKY